MGNFKLNIFFLECHTSVPLQPLRDRRRVAAAVAAVVVPPAPDRLGEVREVAAAAVVGGDPRVAQRTVPRQRRSAGSKIVFPKY